MSCQARRRPSAVGCQPSRAGIGASRCRRARARSLRRAAFVASTCRSAGGARPSPAAAASTASAASRPAAPDAPARGGGRGTRGEDHLAIGLDGHGDVAPEDLEALVALVQVDVGDAVVAARVVAGDREIGDVGGGDAELRRIAFDVVDSVRLNRFPAPVQSSSQAPVRRAPPRSRSGRIFRTPNEDFTGVSPPCKWSRPRLPSKGSPRPRAK